MTLTMPVMMQTLLQTMDTGSGMHTLRLGASLGRRLAALTAAAGPTRSWQDSPALPQSPPCTPRAGAARRARRMLASLALMQHPLHFPPLNRRGGSDEPSSPATISRTLILHDLAVPTAGAALGLTPDASLMLASP